MAVRSLALAAGASAMLGPLAAAQPASAGGIRCGGTPLVCFEALSLPDLTEPDRGTGLDVARVNLFTKSTEADVRVTAQLFMFRRDAPAYLAPFKTQSYLLPRARFYGRGYTNVTKVAYCDGLLGGRLPNRSFVTPCHNWEAGYRLGANFYRPDGRPLVQLSTDDETLSIKS